MDPTKPTGNDLNAESENAPRPYERELARRELLKAIATAAGLVGGYLVLPPKWTAPFVDFGLLPAHAYGSSTAQPAPGCCADSANKVQTVAVGQQAGWSFADTGNCVAGTDVTFAPKATEIWVLGSQSSTILSASSDSGTFRRADDGTFVLSGHALPVIMQVAAHKDNYNAVLKVVYDASNTLTLKEFGTPTCVWGP